MRYHREEVAARPEVGEYEKAYLVRVIRTPTAETDFGPRRFAPVLWLAD